MRVADLSQRSGVPVGTIKFYLREGLLPAGVATARNQADYDDGHLTRLLLVRVLSGFGRLSLSSVRQLLTMVDDPALPPAAVGRAVRGALLEQRLGTAGFGAAEPAWCQVDDLLATLGWRVGQHSPARHTLARVLAALQHLNGDCDARTLAPYAAVATRLAILDLGRWYGTATQVAAAAVLFDAAFAALQWLAREHGRAHGTAVFTRIDR